MKQCKDCILNTICSYYDKLAHESTGRCPNLERRYYRRQKLRAAWGLLLIAALLLGGCSLPDQHSGHIWIYNPVRVPVSDPNHDPNHDPNYVEALHVEATFDRPMKMSVERDGFKVEASSIKPGFFEDIIKFLLLRPR